ncbi:MAG: malate dehydrogenase [Firmicutes bacterium]|nr:malate dehydrogenase [Bacillota bacterium]
MRKKITIAGAGRVGSTAVQLCAYKELGDIVLFNRTAETARGIALDLSESAPILGFDVKITGTNDFEETKNSDVIVITAGSQRKEGMSREELLCRNADIVESIAGKLAAQSPDAVLIVVTNPLDVMVHVGCKYSGFKKSKVIGMAGILDTSRFRSFISGELNVSVEDVSAIVLGGHSDVMVPLPEHSTVNGIPITELLSKEKIKQIIERTKKGGAEIVALMKDSSAFYAPGTGITQIVEAVVKDKKRVLPCAAYLNGQFGLKGIFMGVPAKIGAHGVEEILEFELNNEEKKAFYESAESVRKLVEKLNVECPVKI